MKNDLNALDRRLQISDHYYRDILKRKDLQLQDLQKQNEVMKLQLEELDFKLKLKTSRLQFEEKKEYKNTDTVRTLVKDCEQTLAKLTNVLDEDILMSEEEEVIQLD